MLDLRVHMGYSNIPHNCCIYTSTITVPLLLNLKRSQLVILMYTTATLLKVKIKQGTERSHQRSAHASLFAETLPPLSPHRTTILKLLWEDGLTVKQFWEL